MGAGSGVMARARSRGSARVGARVVSLSKAALPVAVAAFGRVAPADLFRGWDQRQGQGSGQGKGQGRG